MGISNLARAAAANGVAAIITHWGLIDASGTELSGGSYARVAGAAVVDGSYVVRPPSDLTFAVPAGKTAAGWRAFTAATGSGIVADDLAMVDESYTGDGFYVLLAANTGIAY